MATEPENVKQDNPTSQESVLLFSKAYSEARKREQAELVDHLRKLGLPIIDNDPYKTLSSAFAERERQPSYEERLTTERERANRAHADLKSYKIKVEMERIARKLYVANVEDAVTLFLAKYSVEYTNEGMQVYTLVGEQKRLALDERSAEPASLEYVMRRFLDDKPHLVCAIPRNGVSESKLIGSPRELVERYKNGTPEEKRQVLEALKKNPNL